MASSPSNKVPDLGLSKHSLPSYESVREDMLSTPSKDVGPSCESGRLGPSGPEDSEDYAMNRHVFGPVRDSARCL